MTVKQAKAIKHIIEDGDSVSKAMLKAGYKPSMAKNPQRITKSAVFIETLEKVGLTDIKLAERLNEGLDATKAVVMGKESTDSFVDIQPDFAIRHKYLETGLKLKGHSLEKPNTVNVVVPILGGFSKTHELPTDNGNLQTRQVTEQD